jgi:hypothetical protein
MSKSRYLMFFAAAAGCIAIGVAIGGALNVTWNGKLEISTVDFVTVVLSSISVLLTLLTIFLAVFGFIGWRAINDRVRDHSLTYLGNELQEGKPMFTLIQKAVLDEVYKGVRPAEEDVPFDDDTQNDRSQDGD